MKARSSILPILAVAALAVTAGSAHAQSVRVTGVSTVRYIAVRPFTSDSIAAEDVIGDGLLGETPDGLPVRCITDQAFCYYSRPDDRTATIPFLNDVTVSAWGLGRGVRLRARLFVRAGLEGDPRIWPRANDPFDAVELYVDVARAWGSVRAGRQARTSGLGYYNYDGASVTFRPSRGLALDAYGGWSLARGLNEPRNSSSLQAIEPFAPEDRGLIFGLGAAYRPSPRGGVSLLYQREDQNDLEAQLSERVALAANYNWTRISLGGSADGDLALGQLNHANLQGSMRLGPQWSADLFARHYQPFFELWTIWGAFSPVAFDEAGAGLGWRPPGGRFDVRGHVAYRAYQETEASTTFGSARDTGWRAGATVTVDLGPDWELQGMYSGDVNPGAARTQGGVHVRRNAGWNSYVGLGLQVSQLAYEYRINEGYLTGLVLDGGVELSPRTHLSGSLQGYLHRGIDSSPAADWSQFRASVRLNWTIGPEPGIRAITPKTRNEQEGPS